LIPVIIVDSEKLLKQWTDSFFKFTNITEEDIGIISGRISIDKLLEKGLKTYKVYIAMHQSLQSYCKNDWNVVDNLFSKIGIGVKIVDEAHAYWKNMFDIDVHTNIKNNLYLTATPFLSNSAEDQVYQNMVSYIVSYGYTLKFQSIYHNIFYVSWNTHPTDVEEYKMSSNYGFNQNLYNDYLLKEENYNDFLELLDILVDTFMNYKDDTKVAIVVNCNNMVQALYEHFTNDYEFEGDIEVGRFCGLIKKKEDREKELEKKLIITTIKSFNKGVDVDNLSTVINTVSISSKTMIDQLSGRLRYSDKYKSNFVDITDVGFEACRRHLRTRTKFLDKIAKKSIECEF
jgi:superfamily II DNA or RNA helicase